MYKELSLCFTVLMFVTVNGRPITSVPQGYLKRAILMDIKMLLGVLPKDEDELYTPENTNEECARDTMICYMKEIGAIAQEHEKTPIHQTIGKIQRNIGAALNYTPNIEATGRNSLQLSEPSTVTLAPFTNRKEKDITRQMDVCPPCESYELQKTTTFLERMIQFVQFALNDNGLKEQKANQS